nr:unnamed protein product [Digitaria exilis]
MSDHTTCRRQASPLDDDDLLGEILLRVPPHPSSVPRVSLVCKRWRRLISDDPSFLRHLRAHHRKAPLLGFFEHRVVFSNHFRRVELNNIMFGPIPESPDRIAPHRSSLEGSITGSATNRLLGCRHGRVLLLEDTSGNNKVFNSLIVCDPVTGGHVRLVIPPEFTDITINGTVLCAVGDEEGHVHGACHWTPFKVVLVAMSRNDRRPMACIYSSETDLWGNIIWHDGRPRTFVALGNSNIPIAAHHALICWEIMTYGSEDDDDYIGVGILELNLDRQTLTVLKGPPNANSSLSRIIKATDGGVGFATLSYPSSRLRVWHCCNVNGRDIATWVLVKTVDLHNMFGLKEHERLPLPGRRGFILGYDEDDAGASAVGSDGD